MGVKIDRPIIFIGFPRSGTTIISEIIFQHESLAWPSNYQEQFPRCIAINKARRLLDNNLWKIRGQKPQLNKVSWYNKLAFKPTEAYKFWEVLTGENVNFSRDFLINTIPSKKRSDFIINKFEKLIRYQNRRRLAFKITGPGRITYLNTLFPDAIFIEIHREPFSTISSLLKVPFWKNKASKLYWQGAFHEGEKQQASRWENRPELIAALQLRKIREVIQEEVSATNATYYSYSYDDFIDNSRKVIDSILDVTGLDKNSKAIDIYLDNNIIHKKAKKSNLFDIKQQEEIETILY